MAAAMRKSQMDMMQEDEDNALKNKQQPKAVVFDPAQDLEPDEEGQDDYHYLNDEEEAEVQEIMQRGKRMRDFEQSQHCEEDYDAFYEEPDLRSYFSQFNMTEQSQIALCRTWANYLSQKTRVKTSKKR